MTALRISVIAACALAAMAAAVQAQQPLPAEITAPGETTIMTIHGVGAQIYDCKAGADGKLSWQFREPVATLIMDGKTIGHHYPGPSWELLDGSVVVGKAIGRAPGVTANDIPWLKLEIASRRGSGQLAAVTTIQRINTKGGVASGTCDTAGAILAVPYVCDYVFLKK